MPTARCSVPVGVPGGRARGSGIARVAAAAGHPGVVLDVRSARAEAAVQDLDLKRSLLRDVEGVVPADCVLATNTSALSIDAVATGPVDSDGVSCGEHVAALAVLLAPADVAVTRLPDTAGLLLARTVALLVDEAADLAARQGLAPADLDRPVQLGLDHPRGPLARGDAVGPALVVDLLDTLGRSRPGGRYRDCPALRRGARQGRVLRGG